MEDLLFVSGHAAVDPKTLKIVSEEFESCFLKNASDFPAWNKVYAEYFANVRPARTTVVCDFVLPAMLIEIQVTAGVPG